MQGNNFWVKSREVPLADFEMFYFSNRFKLNETTIKIWCSGFYIFDKMQNG